MNKNYSVMQAKIAALETENHELRHVAETQKEMAALFATVTQNMLDMVALTDMEGNFTFAGKAHEILGYAPGFLIGKNVMDFVHPEDLPRIVAELDESIASGQPRNAEYRYRCEDGSYLWLETVGNLIKDENGAPQKIIFSSRDITERRRIEHKLRESKEKYRFITEQMNDVVWTSDLEMRVTYISPSDERILGFTPEERAKHSLVDMLTPSSQEKAMEVISKEYALEETGQADFSRSVTVELEYRHKDGSTRWLETMATGIRDDKGLLIGFHGVSRDITERKRAETERERLITAIEQGDDVVIITDIDGLIQYANPAFETVTGYTRKEVYGQNPRILKSGKQDESFYRDMWGTLTGGSTFHGRMINKRKDGSLYTEDATISPVRDAAGNIVNYVAVKRDVTAHIQLENQLRQAQKMESIGRLAGGVAHDYNNMLSVILGYTEMAMDQVDPNNPLYADLKEVFNAGKRSRDITGHLLAFARKQIISPVVMDLNEAVDGMLKMLRRLIGEDIDFAWEPAIRLWPVHMDPSQLDQILANLCVNARDAIDGTGKITIETDNVIIDRDHCARYPYFITGDYVLLAVSDNGCGMDKETQANLFEPFFTTKETGKGTGLGLATVYGIVKQNNGFITVDSEMGKGTTFKIYLPRHAGEIEETFLESAAELLLGMGEIVLLVEDEPKIIKMGKMMLEKLGYQVLTAETPCRAIDLAAEHAGKIDLLMTDVVMPGMNGRDLAEKLQVLYPDLKRLFMSGYTADVIAHHGVLNEGVHFIQKPFSMKDLAARVREALG
jgi:two-component system, cell cycle sensor histidine kinase and response regulator CckA